MNIDARPTPVLCGPTAGGKSDLALALASTLRDRFNLSSEIVTADAFQVYRGLDIGTAKPTPAERAALPHHLIDFIDPVVPPTGPPVGASPSSLFPHPSSLPPVPPTGPPVGVPPSSLPPFTVQDWLTRAHAAIADIRARGALPIVVGGTHLYIKALLDGLFHGPEPDPELRAELAAMDPAARRAELERVDPAAAARIHPNDTRRAIRALEVFRLTGTPISAHQTQWDRGMSDVECRMSDGKASPASYPTSHIPHPTSPTLLITLNWDVDPLNRRINARVHSMFDRGLPDELRALLLAGDLAPQPAAALGYKQLLPAIREAIARGQWPPSAAALDAAQEQIKIETRRFAKNQRTWLRRLRATPGAITIPMPETPIAATVDAILTRLGWPGA